MSRTVPVLVPLPLDTPFDYALDDGHAIQPGDYVEVPFGPRHVIGVVWDAATDRRVATARLKPVRRRLEAPPMLRPLRALVDHVAAVTLSPLGSALKLALSVPGALEPPAPKLGLVPGACVEEIKLSPARRKVLDTLAETAPQAAAQLVRTAGVSAGVVQAMVKAGLLRTAPLPEPGEPALQLERAVTVLSPEQASVAASLCSALGRGHQVRLLEGLPGAGKTEVYLEAVAATLGRGKQALVLLPEIALTSQVLDALRAAVRAAACGLALRDRQRRAPASVAAHRRGSRADRDRRPLGSVPAVALARPDRGRRGARRQLQARGRGCLPGARHGGRARPPGRLPGGPGIGDARARDRLADARGWAAGAPRRRLLALGPAGAPRRRRDAAGQPARPQAGPAATRRLAGPQPACGPPRTLAAGEQALLFLNRRGFAPLTLCRACGHRLRCPNCSAWLVTHRLRHRLLCHHCGYGRAEPDHCPACGTVDALVACGPGVERLAEEVAGLLPEARSAILTSDRPATPSEAAALLQAMRDHRLDLLIGTQIIAKGHHFPDLTLVGVVDGDLGLSGGDLRAAERQFQLLYQVAGRAGRGARPGRVLIQTHLPEHPVMQAIASGDKERFYAEELAERRAAGLPPFGRLAALIVAARDPGEARSFAAALARSAPSARSSRARPGAGADRAAARPPSPAPAGDRRARDRSAGGPPSPGSRHAGSRQPAPADRCRPLRLLYDPLAYDQLGSRGARGPVDRPVCSLGCLVSGSPFLLHAVVRRGMVRLTRSLRGLDA